MGTGLSAYHFVVTSTAGSRPSGGGAANDRDATATHAQAFYVVGPAAQSF